MQYIFTYIGIGFTSGTNTSIITACASFFKMCIRDSRITYYEKGGRRKRAHHLITRGAAIESIAPLTKVLTETEFYAFAEKALSVPEVRDLLMEAVNEHNRAEQKERC